MVNDILEKQYFQSIDNVSSLINPGYFMAEVDQKSAYCSVRISKHSQLVTGLKCIFSVIPCSHLANKWPQVYFIV